MSTIKPNKTLPVGKKFGRLTVLGEYRYKPVGSKPKYTWQEKLQCDCGNIVRARSTDIEKGRTKSCGCYINDNRHILCGNRKGKKTNLTHGDASTRLYKIYRNIKSRCNNSKSTNYVRYGGRGIKCLRNTYEDFKKDMGEKYLEHAKQYGEKNTQIDRIDNSGDYCKENCRRVTVKENSRNKRNNHLVEFGGQKIPLVEAYEKGSPTVSFSVFLSRIYNKGLDKNLELALHGTNEQIIEYLKSN